MRALLLRLAYSNLWLALTASGLALGALALAGLPLDPVALSLPFASMFAVYTVDKVLGFDPVADAANDPDRSWFIARRGRALLGLAAAGLLLAGALAARRGWLPLALLVAPLGVGVAYGWKLLPASFRYRRLKDITGVKSLSVALTWGLCCALLPASYLGAPLADRALGVAFAWITALFLINTIYFDLGDIAGDRADGIRTVPVVLGYARTRALLVALALLKAAGLAAAALAGWVPPLAHALNLLTLLELGFLAAARGEDADIGFVCDVVVDGEGLLVGALAAAGLWLTAA